MRERIAIYPGSFNPIHLGHTAIARHVINTGMADEVWLVVSPQNPLKESGELAPDLQRLEMARLAVSQPDVPPGIEVSDIEMEMPRPSYTIDTLRYLQGSESEDTEFSLIIGSDNLAVFGQWKDYRTILNEFTVLVYPRKGHTGKHIPWADSIIWMDDAPLIDCSSTQIRAMVAQGENIAPLVGAQVGAYIEAEGLYKPAYYMERGKRYMKLAQYDMAMNDFLRAAQSDPGNTEAQQYIAILEAIFEFRHLDLYNP